MPSHPLYGWAVVRHEEIRRLRINHDGGGETPFGFKWPMPYGRSVRYDHTNDLTYFQTLDPSNGIRKVYEVSPSPADPRPGRYLQADGKTFGAVAFGPATGGPPLLYGADPETSLLYEFGAPAGKGADLSRNDKWTAFHVLEGWEVWQRDQIADLALYALKGSSGEPTLTAFVLSGPSAQEPHTTHLLIKSLRLEGPAPVVLECPTHARVVGMDPHQSYAWLSGERSELCRVYLDGTSTVEPLKHRCSTPAVFARARDAVWAVFLDDATLRGVDVTDPRKSFTIAAPNEGAWGRALIGGTGGDLVWTLQGTENGICQYEWDLTERTCVDLGPLSFPFPSDGELLDGLDDQ
ncbi:hypothetical protein ACFRAR_15880 [Kitasatospora sp. NPDC056651]|uniref:hypothetical protein n=1 Tax=Kitasatospora sp. NPDC056651 TaxID=3345892 RepID=UPI0036851991